MRGKRHGLGRWRWSASANAKAGWLAACVYRSGTRLAVGRCDAGQGLYPLPRTVQQAGQMGTFSGGLNLESVAILIAGLCGSD